MKHTMYFVLLCYFSFIVATVSCNEPLNIAAKKALITGVTGQDGSYLAELLLQKGYEVHGLFRVPQETVKQEQNAAFIAQMKAIGNFVVHHGDIIERDVAISLINTIKPDEIYNLAAQANPQLSFEKPAYTLQATAVAVYNLLEAIASAGIMKKVKLFQASSSTIFGQSLDIPQTEKTIFHPSSPYAVAKLCAHWAIRNYRESYGLFACNGILFNHESPRRGANFVTRKITLTASRIKKGSNEILHLGNLNANCDWGYAKDYVEAMWLILQQGRADDYIIATGKTHTVREFVNAAFKAISIDIEWRGEGIDEKGIDKQTGKVLVAVEPKFFRKLEPYVSVGCIDKISKEIGWMPHTQFEELVTIMVTSDIAS